MLVPAGGKGASLWQLRTAAAQLGVPSRIIRSVPSELHRVAIPAIAHYSGVRDGHFTLLVAVRDQSVVLGEMTTCELQEVPLSDFARLWSGYLLVPRGQSILAGITLGVTGALIVVAALLILRRTPRLAFKGVRVAAWIAEVTSTLQGVLRWTR